VVTEEIPALGHTWSEGVVTKEATCTEPGVMTYTCLNDLTHTKTEEIPAAGHSFEDGWNKDAENHWHICTVCGEELSRETITVTAEGHKEAEPVTENEVEVTCTVDGSYETVVYCSVCDEELSRVKTFIYATGHDFGTDNVCDECGYEVESHTHEYTETVIAPTCTTEGSEYRACETCGHREERSIAVLEEDSSESTMITTETKTLENTSTSTVGQPSTASGGCGGTVIGSTTLILFVSFVAMCVFKRKDD
jgi:hypothetical protein